MRWKLRSVPLALLTAFALVVAACSSSGTDATETSPDPTVLGESVSADTEAGTSNSDAGETNAAENDAVEGNAVEANSVENNAEPAPPFGADAEVLISGQARSETYDAAMAEVLAAWGLANDVAVSYVPETDHTEVIQLQVRAGAEPDVSILEPGLTLSELARQGAIVPTPADVTQENTANWQGHWLGLATVDAVTVGVPVWAEPHSLIWYQPDVFATKGYAVPQNFDEFMALTTEMITAGDTPLCVGLVDDDAGSANGLAFVDWLSDLVLITGGLELRDQWVSQQVPTTDPRIVAQMQSVADIWNAPGIVFGGVGLAVESRPRDHAQDLYDGRCLMQRASPNFATALSGVSIEAGGVPGFADGGERAFDVFAFPSSLEAGIQATASVASAFADRPEVWALMTYLGSGEFSNQMAAAGVSETISPGAQVDLTLYPPIQQSFVRVMANASAVRSPTGLDIPRVVAEESLPAESMAFLTGLQPAEDAAVRIQSAWSAATGVQPNP